MTPDREIQRYDCDKGIHYPSTSGPWMKAADLDALLAQERELCAVLVETWAQDNETIQPSYTKMAAAIRAGGKG